jgi:hypothetical protein
MERFVRFSFEMTARDAAFVAFGAVVLMLAFSFDLPLALALGAHVFLFFSLFLLFRVTQLTVQRLPRTEPWRSLEPRERPQSDDAIARARDGMQDVLLRFSQGAAGAAVTLFILSLGTSLGCGGAACHAVMM